MDQKVLTLPLKILGAVGLNPDSNARTDYIKSAVVFIAAIITTFTTLNQIRCSEWNIVAIAPAIETLMASQQCLIRWGVLFAFKKKIAELIIESKTFWRIHDVDPSRETEAEATVQLIWKGLKIYFWNMFATCAAPVTVATLFTWEQALPLVSWFPKDIIYGYEIFYCTQTVFICTTFCMMVGADGLFAAFCAQLIAQFQILNRQFENTIQIETTAEFLKNLQEGAEYHLKLLSFGKKLSEVFFSLLLMQYLITVAATCIELFLVAEKLGDTAQLFKSAFAASTLVGQMGIYCFLAEAVMDEVVILQSTNAAFAVYSSDWHSRDIKKIGVHVQMIIIRASKPVTFSGGGLFVIGRILWFNMFKFSVSLFTLLTSTK